MRTFAALLLIMALALPGVGAGESTLPISDTWSLAAEIAKQGTLGLLCIVILWSYRRDFFRDKDEKQRELLEEKARVAQLKEVLQASTTALTNSAVATARQTDATHRLAKNIEQLEEKFGG